MKKEIFLLLCGLGACQPHKEDVGLKTLNFDLVERITEFPDSSFFSEITHIECHDDHIYLMDKNRGDLIALTEDFKQMECIAPHSEVDLVMPISFTMYQDTAYVCDEGSGNTLKVYTKGKRIKSLSSIRFNEKRMAVDDFYLYVSHPTDSSSFLKMDKLAQPLLQAGVVEKEKTAKRTRLMNRKFLFLNDGILYAISEAYPYIDSYCAKTGEWLKRIDLSDIPIMQSNLAFIKNHSVGENSYYCLVSDACIHANNLYLLCPTFGDDFMDNILLKIDINDGDMKPIGVGKLPGDIYYSIGVSDNYLYAVYKYLDCAIEKYELKE